MKKKRVRDTVFFICWQLVLFVIAGRLFYWQIIKGSQLQAAAENQYVTQKILAPTRGSIYTADGYQLVGNQKVFRLYADPQVIDQDANTLATQLLPYLLEDFEEYQEATEEATKKELEQTFEEQLQTKLNQKDKKWVSLKNKISQNTQQQIEQLDIYGLGFEPYKIRYYPEASMAAHVTGFVGKDENGLDKGYFGIEGIMDKELKGKSSREFLELDALGLQHIFSKTKVDQGLAGRDITLTLRRDMQYQVENMLEEGIEKYGAKSGEVVIMEPKTGKILALAAFPKYDQATFYKYDPVLYKNPTLANQYEPGSTFKTLTVAIGLDTNSIDPDTQCPSCNQPKRIGQYTIRTWNDVYNPDITMTEALAKSDNIAMIFIAEQVGQQKMLEYIDKFGIGKEIEIDLQEDTNTPIREKWGEVHLATTSFGQGIVTNSMQMVRAVGTIANQGVMMQPYIVEKVIDPNSQKEIVTKPTQEGRVISAETATKTTQMMVRAAEEGEAQWTASQTYTIAGKTGTSQVVTEDGYDEEKTIASFIGFAPAIDPQFVMLVKLVEPESSPWAAETAAPLWYKISNKLFLLLNIPPDKQPAQTTQ